MDINFGTRIKAIREERGMTLEEMADYLGTTKQALSRYERGERTPKITIAAKFAEKLGVPLKELVGTEEGEEEKKTVQPNENVRLLINGLNKLTPEQIQQATEMMKILFANPHLFEEKGNDDGKA